jgi:hypothetical protein
MFEVMDAQLAVRRGLMDRMSLLDPPSSALDAFDPEPAPPPFVERRKSPSRNPEVIRNEVAPAALSAARASDHLSPEALEAIATRVAEKLQASMAVAQPAGGGVERRAAGEPRTGSPQPMITIRVRRPFFRR